MLRMRARKLSIKLFIVEWKCSLIVSEPLVQIWSGDFHVVIENKKARLQWALKLEGCESAIHVSMGPKEETVLTACLMGSPALERRRQSLVQKFPEIVIQVFKQRRRSSTRHRRRRHWHWNSFSSHSCHESWTFWHDFSFTIGYRCDDDAFSCCLGWMERVRHGMWHDSDRGEANRLRSHFFLPFSFLFLQSLIFF